MSPRSLDNLAQLCADAQTDALLVSNLYNVRYLSGFTGSNALLLATDSKGATLFTDPRYDTQAREQCGDRFRVKVVGGPLVPAAVQEIKRRKLRRIGFERERIAYNLFAALDHELPSGTKLVATGPLIERLRMVKSDDEIAAIRRSVAANSAAFDKAVSRLKPSMTEADLAAELEYQQRRQGAEKPSFETIVASGAHSALPHAEPRRRKLDGGAILLVDMGAMVDGYASDMTRTLHLGKASPTARKLYKAVLEAQLAGIDAIRPGVTAGSVDKATRGVLVRHGLEPLFVHSTGHGLGLEIHEGPRLGKKDKTRLEPGMVVTVEPGVYMSGFGGVRIEDTVLVTATGVEVLTPTSKEFTQL